MTTERMAVYIAGPMRGYPEFNFPAFDAAAERLRGNGYHVFNPADHDREVTSRDGRSIDELSIRECLAADTNWICSFADAVAVLDGWEDSRGARAEVALAHALGIPVAPVPAFRRGRFFDTAKLIDPPMPRLAKLLTEAPIFAPNDESDAAPAHTAGEVRTVASSGGEKGVKTARFDLLPARPMWLVAEHYGKGAEKYADRNWERGYEWSKSFGAMMRHAWLFWGGEDIDAETNSPHLAAVVFHALALLEWAATHPEFDDRPGVNHG